MVQLQVLLHSGTAAFLPGEQVSGEVTACVDSPTEARRIHVEVFGHAFNKWSTSAETYEYCKAEEKFINVTLVLWKPPNGTVGAIEPGNYCFPFRFVIPSNALPTHKSRYGLIEYWCKAKVDRPSRAIDEATFPFVVANVVDLNTITSPTNAVQKSLDVHVGCLGCNGVLTAEVSIDKFGYAGGETMLLCIDIDNASNESVRQIRVRLSEEWIYEGYLSMGQHETRRLPGWHNSFEEAVDVEPRSRDRYERRVKLPVLEPSYGCKIIAHSFYVEVIIVF
ncbi:arrestin domain-containing protein 1-like protein [Aphelenchoides avenae]|nr:arrestin domain-containing protein 1-like protein [Aphelenchus avenae]